MPQFVAQGPMALPGGAPPSYTFLDMVNNPGGAGQTVTLNVTIPGSANLLVVGGLAYNVATISSVTAAGFAMTQDATITASGSGATAGIFSIPTATCGTGAVSIVLTASAAFIFRSIYAWSCSNLVSTTKKQISTADNGAGGSPVTGTISITSGDLLFATGVVQGAAGAIDFSTSTPQAPTSEHANLNGEDSADWLTTSTATYTINLSFGAGNHNGIYAAASYA